MSTETHGPISPHTAVVKTTPSSASRLPSRTQSLSSIQQPKRKHAALQRTSTTLTTVSPVAPGTVFSYREYEPVPEVAYTTSIDEADSLLSRLEGPVLGLDMEWPYSSVPIDMFRFRETIGKTAMIQVCDERLVVLIHLKEGNNMRLPRKLIDIMQNPDIYKCGVQIRGDGIKLWKDFPGAFPNGLKSLLELGNIARCVDANNEIFKKRPARENRIIALPHLSEIYLGKILLKPKTERESNWAVDLTDAQREYAINDVYAGLVIYNHLNRLAKKGRLRLILDNCSNNIDADGNHYRGPIFNDKRIRHCLKENGPDGGLLPLNPDGSMPACAEADDEVNAEFSTDEDEETDVDEEDDEKESEVGRKRRKLGRVDPEDEDPSVRLVQKEGECVVGGRLPAAEAGPSKTTPEGDDSTGESELVKRREALRAQDSGVDVSGTCVQEGDGGHGGPVAKILLGGWSMEELHAAAQWEDDLTAEGVARS